MSDAAFYYHEKARQCRRLVRSINDEQAIEGLTALAKGFEAKAKAAEATERTVDLLGSGTPCRLVSDQAD